MAYKKENNDLITNADTLVRRAWIESAIECVRTRVESPLPVAEAGNIAQSVSGMEMGAMDDCSDSSGPHLVLAWSNDQRRSGT